RAALLAGAWKNLLGGVTHVVHHDRWESAFDVDFPINVVRIENGDSVAAIPETAPRVDETFAVHVAEGVGGAAADDVRILATRGHLNRNLFAVHAVGACADRIGRS